MGGGGEGRGGGNCNYRVVSSAKFMTLDYNRIKKITHLHI